MNSRCWIRVVTWLFLVKAVYLAGVLVSVALWPDFDEERSSAINALWFDASARSHPESGAGLSRHLKTWDAQHYLFLSDTGYSRGVKSCAFYPLWPLMIRWFSVLTGGSHVLAGMILANAFSFSAWVIFYLVASQRFGESVALWALVLLVVFPGSIFYQFIYSEPLFFLLVTLLWLGLERERYGWARAAAFLLPLCRPVRVFCVLPILWHLLTSKPPFSVAWFQKWALVEPKCIGTVSPANSSPGRRDALPYSGGFFKPARAQTMARTPAEMVVAGAHNSEGSAVWTDHRRYYALLTAPFAGWAIYLALMWNWTGNVFEGMEAQKYWGVHSISNLWNLPKFVIGFFEPTTWHAFSGSVVDRCAFVLLVCCLPVIWRMGKDMLVWTYVLGILPAMSGTFTSFTRFESTAFPVFIALAVFFTSLKWRWPLIVFLALNIVLHVVLLWRFVNFRWAG